MSQIAQYLGTGKRKTSVARVILRPGDGSTWINGRTIEEYFPRQVLQALATAPLRVAGVEGKFDLRARLHGGGPTGQAGALRHGIARALVEADPELRTVLTHDLSRATRGLQIVPADEAGTVMRIAQGLAAREQQRCKGRGGNDGAMLAQRLPHH